MALNREEILNLDLNGGLVEEYVVESMRHKHQATVAAKRLSAALDANDELHAELAALRAAGKEEDITTETGVDVQETAQPEAPGAE